MAPCRNSSGGGFQDMFSAVELMTEMVKFSGGAVGAGQKDKEKLPVNKASQSLLMYIHIDYSRLSLVLKLLVSLVAVP